MEKDLVKIIQLLLKPVVRLCLRYSLPVQALIESVKIVFIETAAEEIEKANTEVTISKLRVATGLHRRDVARIYREGKTFDPPQNYLTGVIGQWQHNSRFLGSSKRPRVLSCAAEDSEFNQLVRLVSSDVHPSSVMSELERIGAVEQTPNGVKLKHQMYKPKNDPVDGFRMAARDSQYLLDTVEENIFVDPKVPNLHITTEYDNIRQDGLAAIRLWMFKQGSLFHKKARQFISKYDLDINPVRGKKGGLKVVLGTFSHVRSDKKK